MHLRLSQSPNYVVKEFNLKPGERILGIKSSGRGEKRARHYHMTLVVGLEDSRFLLLKLMTSRNNAFNS